MITALIAAAILAAAAGPFAIDALLCGRRAARLRLSERVREEQQVGFVDGCGPVRRADIRDIRAAEDRIARTAWRARTIARQRTCARRPDGHRDAAGCRRVVGRPTIPIPPRPAPRPRTCAPRAHASEWPWTFPAAAPRPGLTPLQAIVADLREAQ